MLDQLIEEIVTELQRITQSQSDVPLILINSYQNREEHDEAICFKLENLFFDEEETDSTQLVQIANDLLNDLKQI